MLRLFVVLLFVVAVPVVAQNATVQINEIDVVVNHVEIDFAADGGCRLTGYGRAQAPSVQPEFTRTTYDYNDTKTKKRCSELLADTGLAVKKDMRRVGVAIGDGGVP